MLHIVILKYNLVQGEGTEVWLDVCADLEQLVGRKATHRTQKTVNPSFFLAGIISITDLFPATCPNHLFIIIFPLSFLPPYQPKCQICA